MKAQGTWRKEQDPLIDMYVISIYEMQKYAEIADENPFDMGANGQAVPHPAFMISDRSGRRAQSLAKTLLLTPEDQGILANPPDAPDDSSTDEDAVPDRQPSEDDQAGL